MGVSSGDKLIGTEFKNMKTMMRSIVGDSVAEGSKVQDVIEARSAINEVFSEAHDDGEKLLHSPRFSHFLKGSVCHMLMIFSSPISPAVTMDKERRESKRMLHDVLEL